MINLQPHEIWPNDNKTEHEVQVISSFQTLRCCIYRAAHRYQNKIADISNMYEHDKFRAQLR